MSIMDKIKERKNIATLLVPNIKMGVLWIVLGVIVFITYLLTALTIQVEPAIIYFNNGTDNQTATLKIGFKPTYINQEIIWYETDTYDRTSPHYKNMFGWGGKNILSTDNRFYTETHSISIKQYNPPKGAYRIIFEFYPQYIPIPHKIEVPVCVGNRKDFVQGTVCSSGSD